MTASVAIGSVRRAATVVAGLVGFYELYHWVWATTR